LVVARVKLQVNTTPNATVQEIVLSCTDWSTNRHIIFLRPSYRLLYEGVSKSFRTESITKYTLTTNKHSLRTTQRIMAAKLTRLTQKVSIQLHLVAESFTTCSSRSRWPVRKLLGTSRMLVLIYI
jgi:hypothetical protein